MSRSLADPPHDAAPRADLAAHLGDVSGLPLFRERDGRLEQAVHVTGPASIAHDGTVLDRRDDPGLLFVPALDAPRTFTVELAGAAREVTLAPQRRWEVSVIHHSHLDIGYTDTQPRVLSQHLDYLDAALDLAAADDTFRWNVEANLPLTRWLASRPAADRDAFLERVRERRIEVCALPFTMHTESYSIDELARTLRPAQALREQHGVDIVTAMQTDVPGAAIGLCELLAAAGIRYLSVAHNYAGRSVPYLNGGQSLRRPFWWRAPSGRRLLVWHTDSPHGIAYMEGNIVGLAESYEETLTHLPAYLHALATRPYPYSAGTTGWLTGIAAGTELTRAPYEHDLLHLRVQSAFADNAAPSPVPAEVVREWNAQWAYPRLRMATNRDFFEAAEARLGDAIPTYEGDWADWWADGIGSAAREVGRARRAQSGIRTAQTLHAVADALRPDAGDGAGDGDGDGWRGEVERAYDELALFDEHTWGAANPWTDRLEHVDAGALQWRWKAARAQDAAERVDALLDSARARLAVHVDRPADAHAGVLVFNPAGHERTDAVELLLSEGRVPATRELAVVDVARGERVPCELSPQPHPHYRPRGQRLRFLARDVPAYGFARYAIVADRDGVPEPGPGDPGGLDTEKIGAKLDVLAGCLTSLTHHGAELVNRDSAFGFNQYVYDRYSTASRVNHLSSRLGKAGMWLLAGRDVAGDGVLAERTSSALEERATVRLRAPGARELAVTYRLVHGADRLQIDDVVDKHPVTDKEAVFVAFPFALDAPARALRDHRRRPRRRRPGGPGLGTSHARRARLGRARGRAGGGARHLRRAARPGRHDPPALRTVPADHACRARDGLLVGHEQRLGHELPALAGRGDRARLRRHRRRPRPRGGAAARRGPLLPPRGRRAARPRAGLRGAGRGRADRDRREPRWGGLGGPGALPRGRAGRARRRVPRPPGRGRRHRRPPRAPARRPPDPARRAAHCPPRGRRVRRHRAQRNWGARVHEITLLGIDAVVLENAALRVTVLAGKGTDVVEFAYKPLDLDFAPLSPGGIRDPRTLSGDAADPAAAFMESYPGGWQEVLPNGGAPGAHAGASYGQHGEVALVPWDHAIERDGEDGVTVAFEVALRTVPLRLVKRLSLDATTPELRVEETLVNESDVEVDVMWGHHLAFGPPFLGGDTRLETPVESPALGAATSIDYLSGLDTLHDPRRPRRPARQLGRPHDAVPLGLAGARRDARVPVVGTSAHRRPRAVQLPPHRRARRGRPQRNRAAPPAS